MTRTGEREIGALYGKLPDNPGSWHVCLACLEQNGLRIPKPRLPDSTGKNFLDCIIQITLRWFTLKKGWLSKRSIFFSV